ncbi:MAG: GSCFA domain-containing protein [Alphaproteobacteria bacterium]|nr:GSCFA domain-containing protein [Alphaproteobacteria bacterium]MBV9693147.1 GSCFA domain-containing protein [Alphaproteobacteria bacterium]
MRGQGFIQPDTTFFAMGSCFAVEIRKALRAKGFRVYPDYPAITFDPEIQTAGRLPLRDNINHYDTFTIRQEIERALCKARWPSECFWRFDGSNPFARDKHWPEIFQDPTRRRIFGRTLGALMDLSAKIGHAIEEGLAAAQVVILTLGLTECWRLKSGGLHAAVGPDSEDDPAGKLLQFRPTGFDENYANLKATLDAIWSRHPEKKIVLTVSPVRLTRTWTDEDVVCANTQSKATLRAVAGQLCRELPRIIYWPSFEYASASDVYRKDGIHVREEVVGDIVSAFLAIHSI